jgi:hypothetical protein
MLARENEENVCKSLSGSLNWRNVLGHRFRWVDWIKSAQDIFLLAAFCQDANGPPESRDVSNSRADIDAWREILRHTVRLLGSRYVWPYAALTCRRCKTCRAHGGRATIIARVCFVWRQANLVTQRMDVISGRVNNVLTSAETKNLLTKSWFIVHPIPTCETRVF